MIRITDKIVEIIPAKEFKGGRGERFINWFGEHVSTPQNRVIIGTTALLTQPWIDLNNKEVDEKTRKVSCARTVGKIISGTLTGFAVRAGFIKLVREFSKQGDVGEKLIKKFFTPSNVKEDLPYAYKQYQNAMGMLLAIVGLLVTNFVVDAPLTNLLTNFFTKNIENRESKKQGELNEKA